LFSLLAWGRLVLHAFNQAPWTHIGPILVDEFEASGTRIGRMDDGPTDRNVDETRPKRMLPLLVDENMVDAVFVFERVRQFRLLCASIP
jgi:hypothetical protein